MAKIGDKIMVIDSVISGLLHTNGFPDEGMLIGSNIGSLPGWIAEFKACIPKRTLHKYVGCETRNFMVLPHRGALAAEELASGKQAARPNILEQAHFVGQRAYPEATYSRVEVLRLQKLIGDLADTISDLMVELADD